MVLTLSTFVVLLDASVVTIALPVVAADLGGPLDAVTWVLAAFVLAFAVLLLPGARLADLVGRRPVFLAGLGLFTLASLACGLAGSLELLIAARVAQGAGAALVEPAVLALITTTVPAGRRGLAFGMQGIAAGLGVVLGPIIGGALTTALSWEWVFLINVPIGVAAVGVAALVLPRGAPQPCPTTRRPFDLPGQVLSSAGLFCLVFPIIEGERLGWTAPVVLGSGAAAVLALVAFVAVERRAAAPLVDLSLFIDRLFAVGNVLRGLVQFVTLAVFFPLTLLLQVGLGYSPLGAAVLLLPLVGATLVASPVSGALSDRVDVRWLVLPGFAVVAAAAAALAVLAPHTRGPSLLLPLAAVGVGLGMLEAPTTSATLRDVPEQRAGVAAGVSYVAVLVGAELGLAVTAAIVQSRLAAAGATPPGPALAGAVSAALTVCAVVALAGAALAPAFSARPVRSPRG
ncbi:DHA2 family efflux MFS transporter permease subunit [Pseudonocardia humida]|uniref:DHA2 family efflux MFS transporter permease subunit n=1 Tax=Pseudonocardia humida TaxID=2800819 RepID=A0ABT1A5S3_9PSEU|nr:DHA2 family efflux MFS transporter permease subunit [Pseudonocardia humida]MCO1658357.1 DHA2 family efflux MFS transporter permease subunit [Pseudonocardia humida]